MVLTVPQRSSEDVEGAAGGTDKATEANTRTTLEDLYSTLKKLEEEENFLSARTEKKHSWCKSGFIMDGLMGLSIASPGGFD